MITNDGVSRVCPDGMIEAYLKYSQYQESPQDFHLWCCISVIAAALGRRCYIRMGMWETYPNMYIILVGESAITHKSTAIKMALRPLRQSLPELTLLGQKMSPEAMIHTLAEICAEKGSAQAMIESSELSNLLGKTNLDDTILKLLTELWDSGDYFTYVTLKRGIEEIRDIYINLLGGSTPSWLKDSVPQSSLEGGFFSRLILVHRPPKGIKNPCPILSPEQLEAIEMFKNDLMCIHNNMNGEFLIDADAQQLFNEWYHEHNHPEKAKSFMRGYFGRKGDFLQKVAMCISASRNDDMRITYEDMLLALRLLNENEKFTEGLVRYMGTTQDGQKYIVVKQTIKNNIIDIPEPKATKESIENGKCKIVTKRGISHQNLIRSLSHKVKRQDIIDLIETMVDSGEVQIYRMPPRGKKFYLYLGDMDLL